MFESRNGAGKDYMIVVDTDILIDVGRDISEAIKCLQRIEQDDFPAISSVTQMELIIGCRNKSEINSLDRFLDGFEIIHLEEQISEAAVDLLKNYRLSHGFINS